MNTITQNLDNLLEILTQQEEALRFHSFTSDDAWNIGIKIRDKILKISAEAVIDITCYQMPVFGCCTAGAVRHNVTWVARKRNTVQEYWKSSYRVALELERAGKTLEDRGLSSARYAASGGGFPIWITGGVAGSIVVSGMTQEQDHQVIVDAVAEHLSRPVPSVLKNK